MTDQIKAQCFDTLIDTYCEVNGVRQCIEMLRNVLELTDLELVDLGFDVNDL